MTIERRFQGISREDYQSLVEKAEKVGIGKDDQEFFETHKKSAAIGIKSNDPSRPDYLIRKGDLARLTELGIVKASEPEPESNQAGGPEDSQEGDQQNQDPPTE